MGSKRIMDRVAEAAARVVERGETLTVEAIRVEDGAMRTDLVHNGIYRLRKAGRWPHGEIVAKSSRTDWLRNLYQTRHPDRPLPKPRTCATMEEWYDIAGGLIDGPSAYTRKGAAVADPLSR